MYDVRDEGKYIKQINIRYFRLEINAKKLYRLNDSVFISPHPKKAREINKNIIFQEEGHDKIVL
jgi:hypothetical protein